MTPERYRELYARAGLSQRAAGPFLGFDERHSRRIAAGEAECPAAAAKLLLLMEVLDLSAEQVADLIEGPVEVDFSERDALVNAAYAATSLADLYVAVTAYEDWHGRNAKLDDRVDEQEPKWNRLPTFGGERPETDPVDVAYSWDGKAVLTCAKGTRIWTITRR